MPKQRWKISCSYLRTLLERIEETYIFKYMCCYLS